MKTMNEVWEIRYDEMVQYYKDGCRTKNKHMTRDAKKRMDWLDNELAALGED